MRKEAVLSYYAISRKTIANNWTYNLWKGTTLPMYQQNKDCFPKDPSCHVAKA
jgi:hypothetical protein